MATATAHRPVTEAEIRQAFDEAQLIRDDGSAGIDEPEDLWNALRPIMDSDVAIVPTRRSPEGWDDQFTGAGHRGTLWADMRASEYAELVAAIDEARHGALLEYLTTVRERVIAAAVAFAEAHPDIPRGQWPIARQDDDPEPTNVESILAGAGRVARRTSEASEDSPPELERGQAVPA